MMRRLLVATMLFGLAGSFALRGQSTSASDLAAANLAWDKGDYIAALTAYARLLESDPASTLEPIARQTGELFVTHELTPDGRVGRFSPDGRLASYEVGTELARATRIVRTDGEHALAAELPGLGASFSPDSSSVVYLRTRPSTELTRALEDLAKAGAQAQNRNALVGTIASLQVRTADLAIRDLASGRDTVIDTGTVLKSAPVFAADGRTIFFIGAEEADPARTDVYSVTAGGAPARLTDDPEVQSGLTVDPTGAVLIYLNAGASPFRLGGGRGQGGRGGQPEPQQAGAARGQAGGQRGQGRGGQAPAGRGGGRGGGGGSFGVLDLGSRTSTRVAGSAPALSADGRTLAYLARDGGQDALMIAAPPTATATAVKKSEARLAAPAVSPDGSRLAFQMMTRDDWEVYIVGRDGSGEARVTREIQHDLAPRFLNADRLLTQVGEARHRRSYIYDLSTLAPTKLFHNNTVRTIAPEYVWVPSADGTKLLIGAERDGDTVSPERGVYLLDLSRKVTVADVYARVQRNLAEEKSLVERGARMFEPIDSAVRRVVEQASVARVFDYEKALFDFDSKHISRPGNRLAAEYLFKTYASFGYQPEYQWLERANALGGRTANVISTLRGTEHPELIYVVSSHYDSVAVGPGADDDTSGTAALLEAARILAKTPMPATIVFASFTGEEAGLLGSREFVRRAVADKLKIVGALNNDMIGWANDHRLDNTIRYSNAGIRDVQHAAAMRYSQLITYDALYYKSTDAAAYYEEFGDIVGGIGSYPVLGNPHYHQAHDLLDTINHQLVTEVARTTAATLMLLASSPSRLVNLTVASYAQGTADLTWTPSPEKNIRSYVVLYGPPSDPARSRVTVDEPRVRLRNVSPGTVVAVRAVNNRGLEGWDWARTTIR
jgi:hypothetical protein